MFITGQVVSSLLANAAGTTPLAAQGAQTELLMSELHSRLYMLNKVGALFSLAGAAASTAFAATHATGTLGATATPIVGLWNPASSTVNLEIIKATVSLSGYGANSAATPGGFTWCASIGNAVVSTGATPINMKTLAAAGSSAKAFANGTGAATGLTNTMALIRASAISAPIGIQPAAFTVGPACVIEENLDGSIIVPPGGFLALLSNISVTSLVTFNSGLTWAEVPTT